MSQLRLDPLTSRWVAIASSRRRRTTEFTARAAAVANELSRPCPFCPGQAENEHPVLMTSGPDGTWDVLVVPNLFPAFEGREPLVVEHLGPVFTQAEASGVHEVVVLHPDHEFSWADMNDDQTGSVMAAIAARTDAHSQLSELRYTQAIVNHGREAGASVAHPHGQLLGLAFVPTEIHTEISGFDRFSGACLLCTTVEAELDAQVRVVYSDPDVVVICPFWSGTPFEMLVLPRHHDAHIHTAVQSDLTAVGRGLRNALASLRETLGDMPYNVVFHSAPYRAQGTFHWHAHIYPKVATRAGFELGTGVLINVMPPEDATIALRSHRIDTPTPA